MNRLITICWLSIPLLVWIMCLRSLEVETSASGLPGDQALRQFSAQSQSPRFRVTLERLKAHPIGRSAREENVASREHKKIRPFTSNLSALHFIGAAGNRPREARRLP